MAELRQREKVKQRLASQGDRRFQHELKEMQETQDLDQIDDDVEAAATLTEWRAEEHNHQPKTPVWFAVLAVATTLLVGIFLWFFNFTGALATAFMGAFIYYLAQKEPAVVRYRIMVDGVALNNTLYHFRDLLSFNVIYEPRETKTVILRGRRKLTPLIHMEIGDADPLAIRDVLLEFLPEDQTLEEPLVDIWARRLGF